MVPAGLPSGSRSVSHSHRRMTERAIRMGLKEILQALTDRVRWTEESQYLDLTAQIEEEFPTPEPTPPGVQNPDGTPFEQIINKDS